MLMKCNIEKLSTISSCQQNGTVMKTNKNINHWKNERHTCSLKRRYEQELIKVIMKHKVVN